MPPLASHVTDTAVASPAPATQVFTPLSTTAPTQLRRASYVRVCDLAKPFNIDDEKLKTEIDKLERSMAEAAGSDANKPSEDPAGAEKTDEKVDTARKGNSTETTKVDAETASATTALSKLRVGGSKENIAEDQFQHQSKSSHKKLSPPSNGFNLCLLVGNVDIVVDKLRVDRSRVRLAEVLVGDETGCCYLRARDDQIDVLKEISDRSGAVVLRNTTIELYQGRHLRLAATKWGKISAYPDQVASTPSPPKSMDQLMNYSAIDLNLVIKEISNPPSPQGGDDSSPFSSSQQGQPQSRGSSRRESFDDTRSTRSHATASSRSRGRRSSRKQSQQQHTGSQSQNSSSQPYAAPYPGAYAHAGMVPGMTTYPARMYSAGQGGSPEIPQYGYQAQKGGQPLSAYEVEHRRKQHEIIAQQFELQQRHHFQQMQLFQQQQENHRRLLQAQQQQLGSPDLSSHGNAQSAGGVPSLSSSAFPPIGGSPHAVPSSPHSSMPLFSDSDPRRSPQNSTTNVATSPPTGPTSAPYPPSWPNHQDQTPPSSPMNPRARAFAPNHDQIQASPQVPYMTYDPALHAAPAAALYSSPLNTHHEHQLYSQVAAATTTTVPFIPAMQENTTLGDAPYAPDPGTAGPYVHQPACSTQSAEPAQRAASAPPAAAAKPKQEEKK